MAISLLSRPLGIDQLVITPIILDEPGLNLVYGTPVRLYGAQSAGFMEEYITADLEGDQDILDVYSKIKALQGSFTWGVHGLDGWATLINAATTTGGASPNQYATLTLDNRQLPGYYRIEIQTQYLGNDMQGYDLHITLGKCKIHKSDRKLVMNKHIEQAIEVRALRPMGNNASLYQETMNQTAQSIPLATVPPAPTISSVSPANAAIGVAGGSAMIAWTFANPVNPATALDPANYVVIRDDTDALVAGTLTINSPTNTIVTFAPSAALPAATKIIAAVGIGVTDLYAQRMASAYRNFFTTA